MHDQNMIFQDLLADIACFGWITKTAENQNTVTETYFGWNFWPKPNRNSFGLPTTLPPMPKCWVKWALIKNRRNVPTTTEPLLVLTSNSCPPDRSSWCCSYLECNGTEAQQPRSEELEAQRPRSITSQVMLFYTNLRPQSDQKLPAKQCKSFMALLAHPTSARSAKKGSHAWQNIQTFFSTPLLWDSNNHPSEPRTVQTTARWVMGNVSDKIAATDDDRLWRPIPPKRYLAHGMS